MSPATDGFSAMINAFPITLTGWIYEPCKNRRKTSFSNQGTSRKFALKSKPEKFSADARARPDTRAAPYGAHRCWAPRRCGFCLAERGRDGSRGLEPTGRERKNRASRSDA